MLANSVLAASVNITEILGYSMAGFIVYYVALRTAFAVDAATFGVSAVTLLAMTIRRAPGIAGDHRATDDGERRSAFWPDIREGISYLRRHAGLRANTGLIIAVTAGVGAFYPLTFLLAVERFRGPRTFGFMEAAIAVGYICGSAAVGALSRRMRKGLVIVTGLMVMGICCALPWAIYSLPLLLADLAVLGAANAAMLVSVDTYVQTVVPHGLRGRVWGARFTLTQGAYAAGVLVAGALAATFKLGPLFGLCGLILFVPALIGLFVPSVRDI